MSDTALPQPPKRLSFCRLLKSEGTVTGETAKLMTSKAVCAVFMAHHSHPFSSLTAKQLVQQNWSSAVHRIRAALELKSALQAMQLVAPGK